MINVRLDANFTIKIIAFDYRKQNMQLRPTQKVPLVTKLQ